MNALTTVFTDAQQRARLLDSMCEGIRVVAREAERLEHLAHIPASPESRARMMTIRHDLAALATALTAEKSVGKIGLLFAQLRSEGLVPCPECGDTTACGCRSDE